MTRPEHGTWVTKWLTAPRFQKYVTAAGGDRGRALALYEWNALRAGTDRTKVHPRLAEIRELRNRAAHMESIFTRAGAVYPQLFAVTRRLDRTLASFISQTSRVPDRGLPTAVPPQGFEP